MSGDVSPFIPDLFHAQKVYVFKALEQDAFPRFLRAKAFANLTPLGSIVRLVAGLLCLWGAFVLAFSLIFLDYKPRLTRLWASLQTLNNCVPAHTSFSSSCHSFSLLFFFSHHTTLSHLYYSPAMSLKPPLSTLFESVSNTFASSLPSELGSLSERRYFWQSYLLLYSLSSPVTDCRLDYAESSNKKFVGRAQCWLIIKG